MSRRIEKIGANSPCPCGRFDKKFKNCCRGKVDWERLLAENTSEAILHLSTRGKNRVFFNLVLAALQLDNEKSLIPLPRLKRAFTPRAVRRIYEAVSYVWPNGEDLKRVLREEAEHTSGLYIGLYEPDNVRRGVIRHSLHSERILLVDPLTYPSSVRNEFNPILHPDQHRTTTLRWISLWIELLPWINAGIIGFVRAPGDFYPDLNWECLDITEARQKRHPELRQISKQEAESGLDGPHHDTFLEHVFLMRSDESIRDALRKSNPTMRDEEVERFIVRARQRREEHPYFIERPTGQYREIFQLSSGTNYEQAKLISHHSTSYLITDIRTRWREMELDRAEAGVDPEAWSPFAKAFQNLRFSFLDNVPLEAALTLRREERLQFLRLFLRKSFDQTAREPFSDANAVQLAAELDDKMREAEVEWDKIDGELMKNAVKIAAGGALAAGPAIASGNASWLGAALVTGGIGALVQSTRDRTEHKKRYPGGFLVDLKEGRFNNSKHKIPRLGRHRKS